MPPYTLPAGSDVQPGLDAPASGAIAVTPSDTVDLTKPSRYLYIGGAGDIVVDTVAGETAVTFAGALVGTVLPIRATRVRATDTTATNIVALY